MFKIYINNSNHRKNIDYGVNENGCWECTNRSLSGSGYPVVYIDGKYTFVHRYMYKRFIGEIPNKNVVRHKCDNRLCINPSHLEIGTQKQNLHDMAERGRAVHVCGEANGKSKLTQEKADNIRKDSRAYKFIAKDYGVAISTIGQIKRNVTWCIL